MASAAGDGGAQLASRSRGEEKAGEGEKRKPLKVSGGARILLLGIPAFQANELKGESE